MTWQPGSLWGRNLIEATTTAVGMTDKDFLLDLKEYIEREEERFEDECGMCRSLDELIAAGEMPAVYDEVLRRLAAMDKESA